MQIIYPGYYTGNYLPDDTFAEEYRCAQQQGVSCLLLDQKRYLTVNTAFPAIFQLTAR